MANASFLLLFFIFFSITLYETTAQRRFTNITTGSSLTPTGNSSWSSQSGLYAFGFYKQGTGYSVGVFISGIPEKTVVWTAKRDDPPVNQTATLLLTAQGMLVLRPTQGQDIYLGSNSQPASSASMLDTGNFVLYNSTQEIIWQSFEDPTDTILVGQPLLNGRSLISSNSLTDHSSGFSRLIMQADGYLVQYPLQALVERFAYYAVPDAVPFGSGSNTTLNLDDDGRLYLFNSSITYLNISDGGLPKERRIYLVRNDVDGIFRLYSYNLDQQNNWTTLWSSDNNRCIARGICGLNGYCVLEDTEPKCLCIPGFDFVDRDDWRAGCVRNSTIQNCKSNNRSTEYNMLELANTVWEDSTYSTLTGKSKEDCESECVKDCNCEIVAFKDRQCRLQKLPLRFGRRDFGDSSVALVKVESGPIKEGQNPRDHDLPKEKKKGLQFEVVIIVISVAAFAFIIVLVSGTIVYRNRVRENKMISEKGNVEMCENFGPKAFSYAELETMTNGFTDKVGRGSFGTVYKGTIPCNNKVVAVTRLEKGLVDGEREFQTEINVIGKTHHRNLVKLLGYCLEGDNRLLVYEYMVGGSLASVLFEHESEQPCWEVRVGIGKDIARGLVYLHDECEMQIMHCDIKPHNILMDQFMCAKVSDFGIAKLLKPDQTKTFTGIRGTKGYVAPEWHRNMPVTVKADVYSFGVVLMEIISGRKSVDLNLPEEEAILEEWVYQCFEDGELSKLVGADEFVDKKKLDQMVKIALWCIQDEPSFRPSMKKVLLMLEGTVDIPIPPSPTCFLSAV